MTKTFNQITVGQMIILLNNHHRDLKVGFAPNLYPGKLDSYRGFYEDLAVEISTYPKTVADLLGDLTESIGKIMTGYKGGEYTVTMDSAIWAANYGDTGPAITGVHYDKEIDMVIIRTEEYS